MTVAEKEIEFQRGANGPTIALRIEKDNVSFGKHADFKSVEEFSDPRTEVEIVDLKFIMPRVPGMIGLRNILPISVTPLEQIPVMKDDAQRNIMTGFRSVHIGVSRAMDDDVGLCLPYRPKA